jgi:Formate/nitrite transporter
VQTNPGLQKLVMGAVGLPFGLIMVMICGAELFTGNTMIMGCAFYEGRITLPQLLRSWVVSFGSESPPELLWLLFAMSTAVICLFAVMLHMPPTGGAFEGYVTVGTACAMLRAAHDHVLYSRGQLPMLPLLVQHQCSACHAAVGPAWPAVPQPGASQRSQGCSLRTARFTDGAVPPTLQ